MLQSCFLKESTRDTFTSILAAVQILQYPLITSTPNCHSSDIRLVWRKKGKGGSEEIPK